MKIALFSDVHANLPAFEAFLADVDKNKPDAIYCLGDLIGYNIWPNEVIAEVRKRGLAMLAGNHDLKTKGYAYELVTDDNRVYLNTLPAHIRLEFQLNSDHLNLVLAHGSTRSINEYVLEDLEENYVLEMMEEAKADILCIGHTHKPYHRIIGNNKHVVNIGSVGKPKDGNPQGCYVLLTIAESGSIKVEFKRFDYDLDKAVQAIINSLLPDDLADKLHKAY
ncbi:metallophosphoesterase family protein [Mucilaginibacter gilvus]|uniref:Metallophosphoesterase n=1 Tax=Mucilaginibacter gilvus TaxID=2305909 RepID=A0A444MJJ4_9SPHI|nr:metallophosphoesterase family protein [Mucilaginibacter gilvus]RWY48373.1 metallophosphoesterase [Mucilaginibacter gilvus]